MKTIIATIGLLVTISAPAQTTLPTFTAGGRSYSNARVISSNAVEITIMHDGGGGKIALTNLPPELQKMFPYDPEKAAAHLGQQKEKQEAQKRQIEAQRAAASDRLLSSLVEVEFDKFRDVTTYRLKKELEAGHITIKCYAHQMNGEKGFPTVQIHFASTTKTWMYLDFSPFIVLYDGKKKDFGTLEVRGSVHTGSVLEQMTASFPFSEFKEMVSAKNVEMRLGLTKLNIESDSKSAMATLVQYLERTLTP
jgi:hypothetical protein